MKVSNEQIIGRFNQVKGLYHHAVKDSDIRKLKGYISGDRFLGENTIRGSKVREEPLYESIDASNNITANLVRSIIKDFASMKSMWPLIDVPDQFEFRNDKTEAAYRQLLKEIVFAHMMKSGGMMLFKQLARLTTAYDQAILHSQPDPDLSGITTYVYDPEWSYPMYEYGDNLGIHMAEHFITWPEYPDKIAELFPRFKGSSVENLNAPVTVVAYWEKNSRRLIAGGEYLTGIQNNFGFVPSDKYHGFGAHDEPGADSDIAHVIGLNIELNKLFSLYHENMAKKNKTWFKSTSKKFPNHQALSPTEAVLHVQPGEDVQVLNTTGGDVASISHVINMTIEIMGKMTGFNDQRTGDQKQSYLSPAGSGAGQRRLGDNLDAEMRVLSEVWTRHAHKFLTQYRIMHPNDQISMDGIISGKSYNVKFKGNDIQNTAVHFMYPPVLFADFAWRMKQLEEQVKLGWMSNEDAASQAGVWNYQRQQDKRKEELKNQYRTELEIQSMSLQDMTAEGKTKSDMAMGTSPGLPGAAPAGQPQPGAEAGAEAGLPPDLQAALKQIPAPPQFDAQTMARLHAERQAQPPQPTYVPPDATKDRIPLEPVADAIRNIMPAGRVKGRVFLVGRIVRERATAGMVEIMLTDLNDKTPIQQELPDLSGRLLFKKITVRTPMESYLDVTPHATDGYSVSGGALNAISKTPGYGVDQLNQLRLQMPERLRMPSVSTPGEHPG